jgi:hypothetical protein
VEEGKQYEFYDCKPGLNVGICLKRDAREWMFLDQYAL